jgi:hypothetical protein
MSEPLPDPSPESDPSPDPVPAPQPEPGEPNPGPVAKRAHDRTIAVRRNTERHRDRFLATGSLTEPRATRRSYAVVVPLPNGICRTSSMPSRSRVSYRGWGNTAGPRITSPLQRSKTEPCHGQTTAPSRRSPS